jgi:hypothetical protein
MKSTPQADGGFVVESVTESDLPEPDARLTSLLEQFAEVAPTLEEVRRIQVEYFANAS